jgi:hypothetical protein
MYPLLTHVSSPHTCILQVEDAAAATHVAHKACRTLKKPPASSPVERERERARERERERERLIGTILERAFAAFGTSVFVRT